jgi:hypothetical protein
MDRHLLARASRMFNSVADLRTEEDRRINEWFKDAIAKASTCSQCGATADSDIHYAGTVDSHEFKAEAKESAE